MRPEKAARISSYLAKNSARISVMNRKKEHFADYYEKSKYAEYVLSEEMSQRRKSQISVDSDTQTLKKRKNFLNGKGRSNILGFGIIVIIMLLAMVLIK